MILSLIAAMDRNRLIGNNNQLPWHLPADFAHFRKITMGKPLLMGRKTYESIGRPLPGRHNIVLTRDASLNIEGVTCVTDLDQAIAACADEAELMVIGGAVIYQMMLPVADRMYLTHVEAEFEGDAWFPEFSMDDWEQVESDVCPADKHNAYRCRFITYARRG